MNKQKLQSDLFELAEKIENHVDYFSDEKNYEIDWDYFESKARELETELAGVIDQAIGSNLYRGEKKEILGDMNRHLVLWLELDSRGEELDWGYSITLMSSELNKIRKLVRKQEEIANLPILNRRKFKM